MIDELEQIVEKAKHASEAAAGMVLLNAICVIEPMLEVHKNGVGNTVIEICENFKLLYTSVYEMISDYVSG
jgi:hypothetical protein